MRHVSRTHRVALDWLSDRINLEPKIQIRYVETKNQLADILTEDSFSRDEWNHFLCLCLGAESAIRPDSLQRAGALGLLHRLLAMDVVDAEGHEDGAEGEDNTPGNIRYGTFSKDITRQDECGTL